MTVQGSSVVMPMWPILPGLAQLEQRLERPALRMCSTSCRRVHAAVDLQDVDVVGLQPLQALVHAVDDALWSSSYQTLLASTQSLRRVFITSPTSVSL